MKFILLINVKMPTIAEGSTPTGGTCADFFFRPNRQDIRIQCALSWKIVVAEWRSVIAVSLNVGVRLIKPAKLYICTQKSYKHNEDGRTHEAGCARLWFRTTEPLGERHYENWITTTIVSVLAVMSGKNSFRLFCA